jgi:hypothetical protein
VDGVDKVVLSGDNEVLHFALDVPEYPSLKNKEKKERGQLCSNKFPPAERTSEQVNKNNMSRITIPLIRLNVPEHESIQTLVGSDVGAYRCNRQEHCPADDPDREENASHHSQEANEEVRIRTIRFEYSTIVRLEDR